MVMTLQNNTELTDLIVSMFLTKKFNPDDSTCTAVTYCPSKNILTYMSTLDEYVEKLYDLLGSLENGGYFTPVTRFNNPPKFKLAKFTLDGVDYYGYVVKVYMGWADIIALCRYATEQSTSSDS